MTRTIRSLTLGLAVVLAHASEPAAAQPPGANYDEEKVPGSALTPPR